jgi:hypothetical protein
MSALTTKSFTAVPEPDGTQLRWVIARIPFDPIKAWPERRTAKAVEEALRVARKKDSRVAVETICYQ